MNAVVVFVEGYADGWYVLRALGQQAGARLDKRKPIDLPTPFGRSPGLGTQVRRGLILDWHDRAPLDRSLAASAEGHEPVFQAVATIPADPPRRANDQVVFVVRMGGDRKGPEVQELLKRLTLTFDPHLKYDIQRLALAFVFDADTPSHYDVAAGDCVKLREERFANEYQALMSGPCPPHQGWALMGQIPWGLFVLHDDQTRSGTLEDLVEPMLTSDPGWQLRLSAAEEYLLTHQQLTDGVYKKASDRAKARLTIAGQFSYPGESLAHILKGRDPKQPPVVPHSVFQSQSAQALATFLTTIPWP